jgi:hypothetical protein
VCHAIGGQSKFLFSNLPKSAIRIQQRKSWRDGRDIKATVEMLHPYNHRRLLKILTIRNMVTIIIKVITLTKFSAL